MNTGIVVGDHLLSEQVAVGGMSDVFRAQHRITGADVRVKLLKQWMADDARFLSMFRLEACYMRWLRHRSIPTLIEYVEGIGERPAIVMNVVNGVTVFDDTNAYRHGVPVPDVFWILLRTLDALEHMHSFGIVHNDVKPANIMFDRATRQVTLLDLGCAHPAGATEAGESVSGTNGFIAPERLRMGSPCSPAGDIYALGVTAACMIGFKEAYMASCSVSLPPHPLKCMIEALTAPNRTERPQTAAQARAIVLEAQRRCSIDAV